MTIRAFVAYLRGLTRAMPGPLAATLALLLLVGFTEGIGLLLLIPLLQIIGLDLGVGTLGALGEAVADLFHAAGFVPTLEAVLAVFVTVMSLSALLQRSANLLSASVAHRYAATLRAELQTAIMRADWPFHTRSRASQLTQVLTTEVSRVVMATEALLTLLVRGTMALVYMAIALFVAPTLALLISLVGAALFAAFRRQLRMAHGIGASIVTTNAAMYDAIGENLGGIKIAKSHGVEDRAIESFTTLAHRIADLYVAVTKVQLDVAFWFRVGSAALLSLFVYLALTVFAIPTAGLLLLLILFARLVPMAQGLQNVLQAFVTTVPAYDSIVDLRQRCDAAAERLGADVGTPLSGAIVIEDVTFAYEPGRHVLRDVTMAFEPGSTTAIVGPSGGGKSTLADLLIGLLVPDEGRILVGGEALDTSRLRAWRRRVGYVPQDAFMFHNSVRENLLVTKADASEEELRGALRAASAEAFVDAMPEGLETVLGDRGVRISGGERQRLALARALLRAPSLLVLDEATSNLDAESEGRVQQAIDSLHGRVTIVSIAHRLATVRRADTLYVLEAGTIVEAGTWDELVAIKGGRFRTLCLEQGMIVPATAL